jgi:hypothetical protein
MSEEPEFTEEKAGAKPTEEEFSWVAWLQDGLRGLRLLARECGVPDEFWEHLQAAEREMLAAKGVLLRAALRGGLGGAMLRALRKAAGEETAEEKASHRATRIQVE